MRAIVSEGSTSALLPGLLTGRYNAAIIHLPVDDPELTIEPLFAEDLLLVTHGDHPLAGRGEMPLAELAEHRLLLPPAGSALRRVLDRAAARSACSSHAQAEIDGVRLLATLAVDGHGAAIVPATAVPLTHRPRRPGPRARAAAAGRRPRLPAPPGHRARRRGPCSTCCARCWPTRASDQPGVRLGTDAFPLARSISVASPGLPSALLEDSSLDRLSWLGPALQLRPDASCSPSSPTATRGRSGHHPADALQAHSILPMRSGAPGADCPGGGRCYVWSQRCRSPPLALRRGRPRP